VAASDPRGTTTRLPLGGVYRRLAQGREIDEAHPVARLIANGPNQHQTWADWVEWLMASVLLRGNALSEIVYDARGAVVGLKPIPWEFCSAEEAVKDKVYEGLFTLGPSRVTGRCRRSSTPSSCTERGPTVWAVPSSALLLYGGVASMPAYPHANPQANHSRADLALFPSLGAAQAALAGLPFPLAPPTGRHVAQDCARTGAHDLCARTGLMLQRPIGARLPRILKARRKPVTLAFAYSWYAMTDFPCQMADRFDSRRLHQLCSFKAPR
jgi:hypothetical protein